MPANDRAQLDTNAIPTSCESGLDMLYHHADEHGQAIEVLTTQNEQLASEVDAQAQEIASLKSKGRAGSHSRIWGERSLLDASTQTPRSKTAEVIIEDGETNEVIKSCQMNGITDDALDADKFVVKQAEGATSEDNEIIDKKDAAADNLHVEQAEGANGSKDNGLTDDIVDAENFFNHRPKEFAAKIMKDHVITSDTADADNVFLNQAQGASLMSHNDSGVLMIANSDGTSVHGSTEEDTESPNGNTLQL
ncbi:hypothetical protein BJ742DRAFT_856952 [Cladochytrium replicatum]|nr:hypothetical protein BJ742DRAFT_856952 [Cladochytrium replicatum]